MDTIRAGYWYVAYCVDMLSAQLIFVGRSKNSNDRPFITVSEKVFSNARDAEKEADRLNQRGKHAP